MTNTDTPASTATEKPGTPPDTDHSNLVHEELSANHEDRMIRTLHILIRASVRVLAAMMTLVILWGVADVVYVMWMKLVLSEPRFLLTVDDIFQLFGAFLVVLIAIEIFINIRLYLGAETFPVQLVTATALMAIARKVIVLDFTNTDPVTILAIAAVVLALGLTHWLLSKPSGERTAVTDRSV